MDIPKDGGASGDESLLRTILDSLESRVHVRDIATDVLLYMNEKTRRAYPEATVGERCPPVLRTGGGRHSDLCTKGHFLDRTGAITQNTRTVEYYDREQKKWYRRNARLLSRGGRRLYMPRIRYRHHGTEGDLVPPRVSGEIRRTAGVAQTREIHERPRAHPEG